MPCNTPGALGSKLWVCDVRRCSRKAAELMSSGRSWTARQPFCLRSSCAAHNYTAEPQSRLLVVSQQHHGPHVVCQLLHAPLHNKAISHSVWLLCDIRAWCLSIKIIMAGWGIPAFLNSYMCSRRVAIRDTNTRKYTLHCCLWVRLIQKAPHWTHVFCHCHTLCTQYTYLLLQERVLPPFITSHDAFRWCVIKRAITLNIESSLCGQGGFSLATMEWFIWFDWCLNTRCLADICNITSWRRLVF